MSTRPEQSEVNHLVAHIQKHLDLLANTALEIRLALQEDLPKLGKTPRAAMMVAGLVENFYTCAETMFVRISQFFGNHLPPDRWHRELLERMCLDIPQTRPRVLSDRTFNDLLELMRFRHFKRYYFGSAYDWDRVDALLERIDRLSVQLPIEVQIFMDFLKRI